ncbi:helix-turn-helix transcriptional regulator [Luteococcus peritonei]|uniref:XRE family transcriptional regulator n=1 Tax=Luteococcus peritonei TaxID=88874 RepID=A0ABW4RQP6_9ACTN
MPSPDHRSSSTGQPDFPDVLSKAIARRNLTLDRLSQRLRAAGTPVSIATLSYWQTGRSLPTRNRSLKAIAELEKILRVPVGHLTSALPGDAISRWEPVTRLPRDEQIDGILREMGIDPRRPYTTLTVQDSLHVDRANHVQTETTRQLIRAEVDGLDRFGLAFQQSSPEDVPPSIQAGVGCSLGRVVQFEEDGLVVGEILLPRPLRHGELAMMDYEISWDTADDFDPGFARELRSPVRYQVMDLHFDNGLPREVNYWMSPRRDVSGNGAPMNQQLAVSCYVQMVLTDPAPGSHGMGWTW